MRRVRLGSLLAVVAIQIAPVLGSAQEWRVSGQVGRVGYPGAPGGGARSSGVLGLSRTSIRDWFGLTAGLPVDGGPYWGSVGGYRRLQTGGAAGLLLDLSAHGFAQGEPQQGTEAPTILPPGGVGGSDSVVSGFGAGGEVMAGGFVGSRRLAIEAKAGAAGQTSEIAGVKSDRLLPTGSLGLAALIAPFTLRAETRGWLDHDAQYTLAQGTLEWSGGPIRLSGSVGRWFESDITSSALGASAALGGRVELIAGARWDAFDPLYLTVTTRSAWAGLSVRLGRAVVAAPTPARYRDGRATFRLPARGAPGPVSIAGDFNQWTPALMRREGGSWVIELPLSPGVYHYAFVGPDGTWFVPESFPGRRPDGMGGWVAVLVVSQ